VLGWVVYLASDRYGARLRENLAGSGLCTDRVSYKRLLRQSVAETGKGATELVVIWFRALPKILELVRECAGWEHIEALRQAGKGVIFVSPHLGCFDIAAQFIASRIPITFLYRPSRLAWVEPLMRAGRNRGAAAGVPADRSGVRLLLKTLKQGGAIGILPDQVPSRGDGVWADFFGRPAYTMTLIGRLHEISGAGVVLTFAERLPRGRGYRLFYNALELPERADKATAARELNRAVEDLIRRCPAQYLWSYNRYKVPAGVEPPC
jgi:Kdo2-lipid IVA lauroyltransferase/acyltransferase